MFNLIFADGQFEIDGENSKSKMFWFVCFQVLLILDIDLYLLYKFPNAEILGKFIFLVIALAIGGILEFFFLWAFSKPFSGDQNE